MLNNEILAVLLLSPLFAPILFLRFFVGFLSFGFFCCVLGEFFYVHLVFCLLGLLMLCLVGTCERCERNFCGGS